MYGKKHTDKSKQLMSKVKIKQNKLNPRPKKVRCVMTKEQLSKHKHEYMTKLWQDEHIRQEKLNGIRNGAKTRRLYSDDVVKQLRLEYLECNSFKSVSDKHPDITYNQVRNLIKFGTTHNLPNNNESNWLNKLQQ